MRLWPDPLRPSLVKWSTARERCNIGACEKVLESINGGTAWKWEKGAVDIRFPSLSRCRMQ
ncbi:hypothetical protein JI435_408450 [Parastagonospora nodorum SN15]|uniref:Uncharacterized protein n=1 Tax=Phaeosphaeria nodorum (strain SN15 / ATCC MYA-4574 / FGSC 10173) TaxID=321614 RepID=A0A7U2F019_PHANO|nr:hypothetical protein JI435_408450 [Parastagonospora nodorum SN15]